MFKTTLLSMALLGFLLSTDVVGQEPVLERVTQEENLFDDWEEADQELHTPWQYSGFVEQASGTFTQDNVIEHSTPLNELRGRLELGYSGDKLEFFANGDLLFDEVLNKTTWDTRELNVSFSPLSQLDVKLGRQLTTWGTGDYLFLNDLFPKDWQSFFAGRDDEYLKAPSDSIRTTAYIGNVSADLSYTPEFKPDNYINGKRFSFYSPVGVDGLPAQIAPEHFTVDNTNQEQWSLRLATTQSGIEYALYGYKGIWTTPVGIHVSDDYQDRPYFPQLRAYGASIRMPFGQGVLNAEMSIYNSIEDSRGDRFNIPNDQTKVLLGYEQELVKNLTGSVQYYLEHTSNYGNYQTTAVLPEFSVDKNRHVLTSRLTYSAMQQKLISTLFVFYSPSDDDGYFKPSINYRQNDKWSYAIGANIFWGKKDHTFFGQHQENSNLWLRARFSF